MGTYSKEDYERIAAAIGKDVNEIMPHEREFEAAAIWYRAYSRTPRGKAASPSKMRNRMNQVGDAAQKLLRHLEVYDYLEAPDGPGNRELLAFLASAEDGTEDEIIRAVGRVGRLVEVFEAIHAARLLKRRAEKAAEDAVHIGKLLPKGHHGDIAANEWIAAMMSLYKKITGRDPRTSVVSPGRKNAGKASGPLIRFLAAAGKPLDLEFSTHSWRGRVSDNLAAGRRRRK